VCAQIDYHALYRSTSNGFSVSWRSLYRIDSMLRHVPGWARSQAGPLEQAIRSGNETSMIGILANVQQELC
jgi:hypothetical protein